jgi:hypothetical protein
VVLAVAAAVTLSAPLGAKDQVVTPSLRRLDLERAAAAGELDWVLGRLDASRDDWSGEQLHDEVKARLGAVAAWLKGEAGDPAALVSGLLSPHFRGDSVLPAREERVIGRDGLEAWRGGGGGKAADLDAEAWGESLQALRRRFTAVVKAKFKVFGVEEQFGPALCGVTLVLLEADGRGANGSGADGKHLQVRTVWKLEWRREPDGLRLAGMDVVSFESAALAGRAFTDASAALLGGDAAYEKQLVHGLDYWRKRLDSASGIDFYGHQGVAVGDIDGDGWDDFYVPQPAGLPNRLFRNAGGARFEDFTESAGVGVLDNSGGALLVDLDNDGDADLVVATSVVVLLFENDGKGRFRRRESSGLDAARQGSASTLGCAAADYDLDGDLDLYVFSYLFWAGSGSKLQSTYPYPYHDANNGAPNFLFRNDGGLVFRDVTKECGMDENNRRFSLAASWCDYDDDGDPDLYVANDFGRNNLYRNDGGRFRDVAGELGVEDTGNGMSVAWEDYDNDGRIDLYVGNMWSSAGNRVAPQRAFGDERLQPLYLRMVRGNSLFRNLGGRFEDVSAASGASFGRWSWSSQFVDVEGDGSEDLYILNGFVTSESEDDL